MLVKRLHFLLLFMILCGDLWNGRIFRQHRDQRILFCKMGNAQMAPHWFRGPDAIQWPWMSLSQTLMQNHTLATLPQRQVHRRTRQQPTKSPSMMTHILLGCHRNRRYLEGCWANPGNWQTGHINPWRPQRIHLSVSAVVNGSPKGEMRSPSSTILTPIRRRCSHTLLSTMLSLRLCASGRKIIMVVNLCSLVIPLNCYRSAGTTGS